MGIAGLLVTILGFLVAVASVGISSNLTMRLIAVLIGIGISLAGIMGMIIPAFRKKAVWRNE
jgi:hypothetical protein